MGGRKDSTANAKARRAPKGEFPKMLFKRVLSEKTQETHVETRTVADPVEEKEAAKEGWKDQP